MTQPNVNNRTMFACDNLGVMRNLNSECIDLIYLDPPFNKKKKFVAPINSRAQGAEFLDKFELDDNEKNWLVELRTDNEAMFNFIEVMRATDKKGQNQAYVVYMAIRLLECRRVLKASGSIYLHCDHTMSHYLKLLMDFIFGVNNFRNEIVWGYRTGGASKRRWSRKHDVLLYYAKDERHCKFNSQKETLVYERPFFTDVAPNKEGKYEVTVFKRDIWDSGVQGDDEGLKPIINVSKKRTGYSTQKPLGLLQRIVEASSKKGDWVLDPFCGCATACVAAEALGRKWIGIDKGQRAWELVEARMQDEVGGGVFNHKFYFENKPPKPGEYVRDAKKYIYVISNKAYKGWYKIGIAKDAKARFAAYLTYAPPGNYKLEFTALSSDVNQIENLVLKEFGAPGGNEWLQIDMQVLVKFIKRQIQRHG